MNKKYHSLYKYICDKLCGQSAEKAPENKGKFHINGGGGDESMTVRMPTYSAYFADGRNQCSTFSE
jgi:hypothetical protein